VQRFSYVYSSQDELAFDMSDGLCRQFVQNHDEDCFTGGNHDTAPDQSISDFNSNDIAGGLPTVAPSLF
jgi:hypothetical protein